jgi:hypothetical protein
MSTAMPKTPKSSMQGFAGQQKHYRMKDEYAVNVPVGFDPLTKEAMIVKKMAPGMEDQLSFFCVLRPV